MVHHLHVVCSRMASVQFPVILFTPRPLTKVVVAAGFGTVLVAHVAASSGVATRELRPVLRTGRSIS